MKKYRWWNSQTLLLVNFSASVKSFSSTDSYSQVFIEEDLSEASEIPLDGRIFVNISIPSSETHTEPNGIQYFVYVIHVCLRYDSVFCNFHVNTNTKFMFNERKYVTCFYIVDFF